MKHFIAIAAMAALVPSMAFAQGNNNANPAAPGQDRVCLVTTSVAGSFNDDQVIETKWLPRKAAEAQAAKDPTRVMVFDYTTDPLVTGGTYASAEILCTTHFPNANK